MEEERRAQSSQQDRDMVFALDIGTRSIIGVVGRPEGDRVRILAVEKQEHSKRAMVDGQIEDIDQVGRVAAEVTARLEKRLGCRLERVCIAAAGRALHTEPGHFELVLPEVRRISDELIGQLEAGAVSQAEAALNTSADAAVRFYLVGYTVSHYFLDDYPLTTLRGHNGRKLETDVVATFLPSEVVDSLYAAMEAAGLEVVSLTLEPIAAINAAIPPELRLLNLVMADIGAGTSDIAACRDGSVVGYTMATVAGDEITETLMKTYLVDFATAERMKASLSTRDPVRYTDILGLDQEAEPQDVQAAVAPAMKQLAEELARRIREINGGAPPSAAFLAGGGSKLKGLREAVAEALGMDERRVAVAGSNFKISAFSEEEDLNDPEYATPLGIVVSAGLGLISDSYRVSLNGKPAKLFRSGVLTALDVLMMNGYTYADLIGRTGQSLSVTVDGQRRVFRGEPATPSVLLVNGCEAPPSTVIQAADRIEFTPARSGAPAARTLAEALGGPEAASAALLNGAPGSPDSPLRSGDTVETGVIVPVAGPAPASPPEKAAGEPAAPPASAPGAAPGLPEPEGPVVPAHGAERPVNPVHGAEGPVIPVHGAEGSIRPVRDRAPEVVPAAPAAPAPEPAAPVLPQGAEPAPAPRLPERRFLLNGKPLLLPARADNAPYYLMDLLDRSGLDFDHLNGPVSLTVNGREGAFTQVLHDGDDIAIRVEE